MTLRRGTLLPLLLLTVANAARAEPRAPTFADDVAPILFRHCVPCHRPGESGPFPLLELRDAVKHGREIVDVTESGFMPPWLPRSGYGEFRGARGLSGVERATLRAWFEAGMVEGDPAHLPPRPSFTPGWQLGPPDLVLEMEEEFVVPAEGSDIIRNFVIPAPRDASHFIRTFELRPGNPRVVHHGVIKVERSSLARRLDRDDPGPGFGGMAMGNAESPDGQILVWTPGSTPDPGSSLTAWRLEPGQDVVLQLHMVPRGAPVPVRARLGLYFAPGPPTRETFALTLREDHLDIPPGTRDYAIEKRFKLPVDAELIGIYPHAHYLGKTMHVTAEPPAASPLWLLRIDDWDFNWQGMYHYRSPVRLPAGTVVIMRYTYDNSAENVRNPSSPPRRVVSGNRSTDEMGNLALQVVAANAQDLAALREASWRAMLDDDPQDTGALFNLGVERARRGRQAEAASFYERAARIDPLDEGVQLALAGTYVKLKRTGPALAAYEQVLRLNPQNVEASFLAGWLLADRGRLDEAQARLEQALALEPSHAAAHHRLGLVLRRRGDLEGAILHLARAVELDPALSGARRDLERARAERGGKRP